ncbi:MAG: inositol monophosphatase [bacterium]
MQNFITETILKAGEEVMKHFGTAKSLYDKGRVVDIVTEADLASEKIIVDAIKNKYPEHGIVAEESGEYNKDAEYIWYIDPVDGTKNFATGVQLFGINLAVAQNGKIIAAAICLPALNELCYAEAGKGTHFNGNKTSCSQKEDWEGSHGLGPVRFSPEHVKFLEQYSKLTNGTGWSNSVGSPAVSAVWVATGRRDWYKSSGKNSWDFGEGVGDDCEASLLATP